MELSTHVLDTALGRPAIGVKLTLSQLRNDFWQQVGSGTTDSDGRCRTLLDESALEAAIYKLHFATSGYYAAQGLTGLYPFVEIVFQVTHPDQHHHIPLLLTANGYTTYRGS